jgi:hypothetical protein
MVKPATKSAPRAKQEIKPPEIADKILENHNVPIVYADRVLNIAISSNVCRLTLGTEIDQKVFNPNGVLILPTDAFLQALSFLSSIIKDDENLKARLKEGLEKTAKSIDEFSK